MRLIPCITEFESAKNGTVTLFEFLWQKKLYAGGFEQSGPYLVGLWNSALNKIPTSAEINSVLVVGLGLGENVRLVQKKFPAAKIIIVEWDSVIIQLARDAKRFDADNVEILEGDLRDILPTLEKSYDLVLCDAFFGDQPDVGMGTQVGESFHKILSTNGTLLLNSSRTPAAIEYVSKFLKLQQTFVYKENTIAVFVRN